MSLFNTLFSVGIARRVGFWALLQALPDENTLRTYLRAAYMGLAGIIVGSVLTGAAVSVGLISIYRLLLEAGWSGSAAIGATATTTLILIITCFLLAGRWFTQLANINNDPALFKQSSSHSVKEIINDAVTNITDGFVEGLTSKPKTQPAARNQSARRIRLIS
jgi:hypothetical protein